MTKLHNFFEYVVLSILNYAAKSGDFADRNGNQKKNTIWAWSALPLSIEPHSNPHANLYRPGFINTAFILGRTDRMNA